MPTNPDNSALGPVARRLVVVVTVLAGIMAVPPSSSVTGQASTAPRPAPEQPGDERLRARIYAVTPSSEPDQITGPSRLLVVDPSSLSGAAPGHEHGRGSPAGPRFDSVDVPDFRPHHFYPVPGRNLAIQAHFGPTANVELFDLVRNAYVGRIATGKGPRHLTFHPSHPLAYTANFDGDSISVLDLDRMRTVATVPVGHKPNYVQYARTRLGPRLFVENFGEKTVTVLDARTLHRLATVTVGDGPFNGAITDEGRTLVTANARHNSVSFMDTASLAVTATVPIGGVHDPTIKPQRLNPRVSPDGRWLWVGNQDASVFSVIDLRTRRLAALLPAGKGADIAFFPAGGPAKGLVLLTNRYDRFLTVARQDGDRPPQVVGRIATASLGSHFITFDKDFRFAYVSQRPGRAFSVVDLATLTEVTNLPVGPDDGRPLDPSRAGPDQAFFIWFEHGRARFHEENTGGC